MLVWTLPAAARSLNVLATAAATAGPRMTLQAEGNHGIGRSNSLMDWAQSRATSWAWVGPVPTHAQLTREHDNAVSHSLHTSACTFGHSDAYPAQIKHTHNYSHTQLHT